MYTQSNARVKTTKRIPLALLELFAYLIANGIKQYGFANL